MGWILVPLLYGFTEGESSAMCTNMSSVNVNAVRIICAPHPPVYTSTCAENISIAMNEACRLQIAFGCVWKRLLTTQGLLDPILLEPRFPLYLNTSFFAFPSITSTVDTLSCRSAAVAGVRKP